MIPLFAAAIGVVYNLPSVDNLILSRAAVNKIFLGQIATWDDPVIQATNPGVPLPSRRIIRLVRSDNAAATQILVRALASFTLPSGQPRTGSYWLQHPLQGSSTPVWPAVNTTLLNLTDAQCVFGHCGRSICSVGQYYDPVLDACWPCPAGTYMNVPGQSLQCTPCEAGHYSEAIGAAFCSNCAENEYQNMSGQTSCQLCPANTRRFSFERIVQYADNTTLVQTVESSAVSIDGCKCVPDFWLPAALENATRGGEPCVACPPGSTCAGFVDGVQTIPSTLQGYWGVSEAPYAFFECKTAYACDPDYKCAKGRHGRMCKEAEHGFFVVGHKWFLACPKDSRAATALTVVLTVVVIYIWINIMNLAEASVHESIDISAKFLHLLCFIAELKLRWHPYLVMTSL
jgi:hypothetical protein